MNESVESQIVVGGTYRHYKGGVYQVIHLGRHSETLESVVIYRKLSHDNAHNDGLDNAIWVRPAKMWNEIISKNGENVPRFTLIDE